MTEGRHCARCGEVFVARIELPVVEVQIFELPAALKLIEEEAFAYNIFECIAIPEGCTAVGARAFEGNVQLRFIEIPASVTMIDETAFEGCSENLVIVTTSGSVAEAYAAEHSIYCVIKQ